MALKQDVLTGVRRGAMLFAVLLAAIAIYRTTHTMISSTEPSAVEAAAPAPEHPLEAEPDLTVGPPVVPPPPPLEQPGPARRIARRRVPQAPLLVQAPPVTEIAAEEVSSPDENPAPSAVDEPQTVAAAKADETEGSLEPPFPASTQKRETRRMRWLKAVGRFLRVGNSTAGPDSFRKQ